MQYMIMTYESENDFNARTGPSKSEYWGAWRAYTTAMQEAGVLRGGNPLQPAHTATTLRGSADERRIQDGPFADTKEQLGGYYVIDVANLDEALAWAARCPAAHNGAVEVRPIAVM
jgi:hypothetical protein